MPLTRFYPPTLMECLREHGLIVPDLAAQNITGFMKGSIDLVFEHQGQYFIADYKSNHLGHQLSDYQHDKLHTAMANNGYQLQAALYALALHRWLSQRYIIINLNSILGNWGSNPCGDAIFRKPAVSGLFFRSLNAFV